MKKALALSKGIIITILFLALSGCGTARRIAPPVQTIVRDSTVWHIKDSTAIHYDTVTVEIPKESSTAILPQEQSSHLETSVAESEAFVDSTGLLHHSIWNKDGANIKKEVPVTEHFHSEDAFEHHLEKETVTVEVEKELTKWQQFKMKVGGWAIGIILLALLLLCLYGAYRIWPTPMNWVGKFMSILKRMINK